MSMYELHDIMATRDIMKTLRTMGFDFEKEDIKGFFKYSHPNTGDVVYIEEVWDQKPEVVVLDSKKTMKLEIRSATSEILSSLMEDGGKNA